MKVCLAGNVSTTVLAHMETLEDKSISTLQSFVDYQTPNSYNMLRLYLQKSKFFIMDSGAFSMLYGKSKEGNFDVDEYVTRYIKIIKDFDIDHYVELDLYDLIGVEPTEAIRSRLEKEIGKPAMPVFHKSLGLDYYKQLCDEYEFICIGGIAVKGRNDFNVQIFRKLTSMATERGCKVHGLGYTTVKNLEHTGFYSVDSTSWLSPVRYGSDILLFHRGKFVRVPKPEGMRMNKQARVHQFKEWLKYAKYMEQF